MDNKISSFDIMQHIRNIYAILGVQTPEDINESSILELIAQGRKTADGKTIRVVTTEEYEIGIGNGTISLDDVCIITDD